LVVKHPFHLVRLSPWPILVALSALLTAFGLLALLSLSVLFYLFLGLFCLLCCISFWFSNILLESTFQGCHTRVVQGSLRLGFLLFIISEVCFFISFFWAYLHFALSPAVEIGSLWPPKGISPIDASCLPLLNTVLLLSSAVSVTCSHHFLLSSCPVSSSSHLILTLYFALNFLLVQACEFYACPFTIADSVFGSSFFLLTGFHGLHVFFGFLFLIVSFIRLQSGHFRPTRHLGFEFAIWYWHFVDVVWLLLFVAVYIFGF